MHRLYRFMAIADVFLCFVLLVVLQLFELVDLLAFLYLCVLLCLSVFWIAGSRVKIWSVIYVLGCRPLLGSDTDVVYSLFIVAPIVCAEMLRPYFLVLGSAGVLLSF